MCRTVKISAHLQINQRKTNKVMKTKACVCVIKYLPAMSHARMAGIEIAHVDPSKILSTNIVNEQNTTVGDVSECVYLGKNSMAKVKTSETM